MTATARYFAACHALNRDEWAPGMRWLRWAPGTARHLQIAGRVPDGPDMHDYDREHVVPDFTDPATIGVLLAAVREAWACPVVHVSWEGPDLSPGETLPETTPGRRFWRAWLPGHPIGYGETEANALIAALEAAAARRGGQP